MSNRWGVLCALFVSHAGLLAWSASRHSPTLNEPGLLAAGLSHWQHERFDLYRVNPPLVRMVACLPLIAGGAKTDWTSFYEGPGARPEFAIGADFVAANGARTARLTTFARWACIPFSLLGASVCYCWARDLYGTHAGLLAATQWCFSSSVLAHASLATADVPCAAFAAAASYSFWRWLDRPSPGGAVTAGIVLGLAELTKMTLVILYPLFAVLWLTARWWKRASTPARKRLREGATLSLLFLTSLCAVNLGYSFEGSFRQLGQFEFASDLLVGNSVTGRGNRFADTWLATLPVPLPRSYVLGADAQRRDFEHTETASYLRGRFQAGGWWYYYLYALGVKVPLGTWALMILVVVLRLAHRLPDAPRGADLFLLGPAAAILAFVSSQDGFSQHSRYVIPILPFLFVWMSQVVRTIALGYRRLSLLWFAMLVWSIASSLAHYPHSLSYFNELAGGPAGGHRHLLGSDLDWGHDLLYLKEWLDKHPEARPLYHSCVAMFDIKHLGIDGVNAVEQCGSHRDDSARPLPGWYAISVNDLCRWDCVLNGRYEARRKQTPGALYRFANALPVARIGYTIYIFHVAAK